MRLLALASLSALVLAAEPLAVPFVPQTRSGCGSAAVAMVTEYWAARVAGLEPAQANAERIDKLLPPDSVKGIRGSELRRYLEENGFDAYVFTGEEADLRHHLQKGRPLIVCFAPRHSFSLLHYAVITAVDDGSVWMNDPARGPATREDWVRFSKEWRQTGNWTLLAIPHQRPE